MEVLRKANPNRSLLQDSDAYNRFDNEDRPLGSLTSS